MSKEFERILGDDSDTVGAINKQSEEEYLQREFEKFQQYEEDINSTVIRSNLTCQ